MDVSSDDDSEKRTRIRSQSEASSDEAVHPNRYAFPDLHYC